MRRLLILLIVALGVAPGTWVRTKTPIVDHRQILDFEAIDVGARQRGEVRIEGLWRLSSPNSNFGSYSGLVALGDDELLAVGDSGGWLRFGLPGSGHKPAFGALGRANERNKHVVDAEAVEFDAETGHVWVAYEVSNAIERSDLTFAQPLKAKPPAMANWPVTSGPESMVRLGDGRFIVLGEGSPDWFGESYPGLLFDGDPADGADAVRFGFIAPDGFRATDMAALPDGRVLILLRKIEGVFPPAFSTKIAIADPANIEEGMSWAAREIATLDTDLPHDNFEGLAAIPRADGSFALWMISDDNGAALQETLLYRLRWTPAD